LLSTSESLTRPQLTSRAPMSPHRALHSLVALLTALFLACLVPSRLSAQLVEAGIVRDATRGTPLECLHVALLDSAGSAVAHTVTDSAGRFLLEAPRPGVYRVQFLIYRWDSLVGPVDTLTEGAFKQRAYPLAFTNMLVPDSAYERPVNGISGRENRAKYQQMVQQLRAAESDSGWRGRLRESRQEHAAEVALDAGADRGKARLRARDGLHPILP
jgi:hypothetical protein